MKTYQTTIERKALQRYKDDNNLNGFTIEELQFEFSDYFDFMREALFAERM